MSDRPAGQLDDFAAAVLAALGIPAPATADDELEAAATGHAGGAR